VHRSGSRKEWLKLHAAVTCVLKAIPSMEITSGDVNDSTQLAALLDSLPLDDVEAVSADAGYLSRHNCDLIEARGAKPYIKLKKNIHVIRAYGSRAWVNMILDWRKNPKAWNKKYHMRSSAESASSAIKRRFGHRLASIRKDLQRKELMTKVWRTTLTYSPKSIRDRAPTHPTKTVTNAFVDFRYIHLFKTLFLSLQLFQLVRPVNPQMK